MIPRMFRGWLRTTVCAALVAAVAAPAQARKDVTVTVTQTLPGTPQQAREAIAKALPSQFTVSGELPSLSAQSLNKFSARIKLELNAASDGRTETSMTVTQHNEEEPLRAWALSILTKARETMEQTRASAASTAMRPVTEHQEAEVARAAASDIDEPPAIKPAPKKAHAVVIGIERYREGLPPADFAAQDARLVAKYLISVLGYPPQNVATLVGVKATKGDFEKYIERWLPNRVEAGDEVFIYYSGHGAPNPRTGDSYLVPYDGDPTYLDQTGYPLKRLYAELAKLPSKGVTVVLDSCFSGAGGRSVLAKGAKPLVTVSSKAAIPPNMSLLSAAASDQITYAYEAKGHGLFTYFLLKGIAEQAVKGPVRLKEAFDFAAPQVAKIARQEFNNDQAPRWDGRKQ